MVIGRSDERNTPDDAKGALRHRMAVEGSFAETIWAAVMTPHRKPGHMIAPDQTPTLLQSALETRGPSTHASWSRIHQVHRIQGRDAITRVRMASSPRTPDEPQQTALVSTDYALGGTNNGATMTLSS